MTGFKNARRCCARAMNPEVTPEHIALLSGYRLDRIVEKHEGPWSWASMCGMEMASFLVVEGFQVLLPLERKHLPNITVTRCVVSADEQVLTLFLQDTTYDTGLFAGYMAVCERVPGQGWYVAIVYHECWISRLEVVEESGL
mgnify:CR=1 FL=1